MDDSGKLTDAKMLLGEEYPEVLELLRGLLKRGVTTFELMDAFVPAVTAALERRNRSRRHAIQAKGIAAAKARRVRMGRAKIEAPPNFQTVLELLEHGEINVRQAARICGCGVSTFYRMRREFDAKK